MDDFDQMAAVDEAVYGAIRANREEVREDASEALIGSLTGAISRYCAGMDAEDWESIEVIDANLTKIITETLKTADDWVSEATARAIIDKVRAIAFRESASAAIRRYQTNSFRAEYWWDTSTNPECETFENREGELHRDWSTMMTALARLSGTDVALVLTQMASKDHDGSTFQVATVEDVKEWRQSRKAANGPQFIVSLPNEYNGHTVDCLVEPIARDGSLVKLQVAGRGREHLIRWIDPADLQTAIASQIATAKAWEYRDEKEGVQFLSLDRVQDDKRAQWTSERPLDSVLASLLGLGVVAQAPAKTPATMLLVSLASENPDKMRSLAERLLVTKGGRLLGRIPARRDEAGALKAMGIRLGGYDSEAGCFHACVEPATLDCEAVAARDLDFIGTSWAKPRANER